MKTKAATASGKVASVWASSVQVRLVKGALSTAYSDLATGPVMMRLSSTMMVW